MWFWSCGAAESDMLGECFPANRKIHRYDPKETELIPTYHIGKIGILQGLEYPSDALCLSRSPSSGS